MRKVILIICIIVTIMILGMQSLQAATNTATLNASSKSAKSGDTLTVTLSATCDGGIALISGKEEDDGFSLVYDSNKLELVSRKAKDLSNLNEESDSGTIMLMGNSSSFKSGEVYEWTLKVKDGAELGSTQISVTPIIITDFNDVETSITVTGTSIDIIGDNSETPEEPSNPSEPSEPSEPTKPINTDEKIENEVIINNGGVIKNETTVEKVQKTSDNTTSPTILPKTGSVTIVGGIIAILIVISIVFYKKYSKLKEIK